MSGILLIAVSEVVGQKDRRELTILSLLGRRLGQQPVAILSLPRVRIVRPALPNRPLALPRLFFPLYAVPSGAGGLHSLRAPARRGRTLGEAVGRHLAFLQNGLCWASRHLQRSAGCTVRSKSAHPRLSLVPRGPSAAPHPGRAGRHRKPGFCFRSCSCSPSRSAAALTPGTRHLETRLCLGVYISFPSNTYSQMHSWARSGKIMP